MGRTGRRISRSLIGALIITLVFGLIFYLKDIKTTQAKEPPAAAQIAVAHPPAIAPAVVKTNTPAIQYSQTPTNLASPTTQPQVTRTAPTSQPGNAAMTTAIFNQPDAVISSNPLGDAQSHQQTGDLLTARRILNDALVANKLSPNDLDPAKKMISDLNQQIVFGPQRFPADEFGGNYLVQPGDRLAKIADKYDVTWELLCRINNLSSPTKLRSGATIKVLRGPFSVIVTKSKFLMDVYLGPPGEKGSMYVTSYPVGLGKDDSTPTGVWMVETSKKIKDPTYYSPRGEGVIPKDDPKNPLGKRWIGLTGINGNAVDKTSYGIHGNIDESSIGKQESMGCIRMHNADVDLVYDLLVEGKSEVIVKD